MLLQCYLPIRNNDNLIDLKNFATNSGFQKEKFVFILFYLVSSFVKAFVPLKRFHQTESQQENLFTCFTDKNTRIKVLTIGWV